MEARENGSGTNIVSDRTEIEGFWNDMNEPAIFILPKGLAEARELAGRLQKDTEGRPITLGNAGQDAPVLQIIREDYKRFITMSMAKKIPS